MFPLKLPHRILGQVSVILFPTHVVPLGAEQFVQLFHIRAPVL